MNQIKDDILVAIKSGTSFVELMRDVPDLKGDFTWCVGGNPNIVLWVGMSEVGIDAMVELLKENKIDVRHTHLLVYLADGGVLQMPLVKSIKTKYKKPHWLPVVFNKEVDI